jgi:sugar O-acyltransferase (sialic acid O-acetyltransferase NeuD family)
MTRLLILGGGGHGKVVAEAAVGSGRWTDIAFLDGRFPTLSRVLEWPVIGSDTEARRFLPKYPEVAVAIGDNRLRLELVKSLESWGFKLPPIEHPTAWLSPSARLGNGTVLVGSAVVNASASLGRACIVNTSATVDHDCSLADGVHVSPGAHIGGNTIIGARTWVGIGAAVRHGVTIGSDVVVGAGAAVIKDVPDGAKVVGVPGELLC